MKTHPIIRTIEVEGTLVSLLEGNIIRIVPSENVDYSIALMEKLQVAKKELIGDQKYAVLMVAPRMGDMDKEAKEFAAGEFTNRNVVAKAIVLKNMGTRLLVQFFIKLNKPIVEHAIFENEHEALVWLKKKM